MRRIAIVGATSMLAEHCAREWLKAEPSEMLLAGRNLVKLQAVAADLMVRSPASSIQCFQFDFSDTARIGAFVCQVCEDKAVDMVLIAHGMLPDQAECQRDISVVHDALFINGLSPVLFAEAFVSQMVKAGRGTLGLIGSVAGDRGRKSNYAYGAAKCMVACYAEGLQHRLHGSGVNVVLIKPGPTDTPMTAHLKADGLRLADPGLVARRICRAMSQGQPVVYAPAKWQWIMRVIRHMPRFVFNRLDI